MMFDTMPPNVLIGRNLIVPNVPLRQQLIVPNVPLRQHQLFCVTKCYLQWLE